MAEDDLKLESKVATLFRKRYCARSSEMPYVHTCSNGPVREEPQTCQENGYSSRNFWGGVLKLQKLGHVPFRMGLPFSEQGLKNRGYQCGSSRKRRVWPAQK